MRSGAPSVSPTICCELSLVARRPPRRRQFASTASPLIDFLQLSLVVSRAARADGAAATWGRYRLFCLIPLFSHQIFAIERAPRPGNSSRHFHDVRKYATRRDSPPLPPPPPSPVSVPLNFSSRRLVITRSHRVTTQTAISCLEFRVANTSTRFYSNESSSRRANAPSPSWSCLVFSP